MPLDHGNKTHVNLLRAIYCAYTGADVAVPTKGAHWTELGFQGSDPSTDLRGGGMLSLWLMYNLHHHNAKNAVRIFKLSTDLSHEFPFAVVCVNATVWTIKALKHASLNSHANRMDSVIQATKDFYVGAMYEFFRCWKRAGGAMSRSGFIMKEVKRRARSSVSEMIKLAEVDDVRDLAVWEDDKDCLRSVLAWPSCCSRRDQLEFDAFPKANP
ncbi:hypothetical protein BSKO_04639 [Bryopsis sp. KO-2023]|nr:hypothetical protein BSKO_04639 [Bryopsis sp. KO-2023]